MTSRSPFQPKTFYDSMIIGMLIAVRGSSSLLANSDSYAEISAFHEGREWTIPAVPCQPKPSLVTGPGSRQRPLWHDNPDYQKGHTNTWLSGGGWLHGVHERKQRRRKNSPLQHSACGRVKRGEQPQSRAQRRMKVQLRTTKNNQSHTSSDGAPG